MIRLLVVVLFALPLALARVGDNSQGGNAIVETVRSCFVCHGDNGASSDPQYPILAGQELYYLYLQIRDFQSGLRENEVMQPLVHGFDKDQMMAIAEFFSEQPWPNTGFRADERTRKAGDRLVNAGQCVACHGGGFLGDSRVPRLAGQHREYLEKTMLDYKYKRRMNAPDMATLLETYSEEEIATMAAYLAGMQSDEDS